jgi:hypothetical protein
MNQNENENTPYVSITKGLESLSDVSLARIMYFLE